MIIINIFIIWVFNLGLTYSGSYEEFTGADGDLHISFDVDSKSDKLRNLEENQNSFYCYCPFVYGNWINSIDTRNNNELLYDDDNLDYIFSDPWNPFLLI